MVYFRLNSDCYFLSSEKGAVLYDVFGRRIILLDNEARTLLQSCEKGQALADESLKAKARQFFELLIREGFGFYYPRHYFIDKMLLASPMELLEPLAPPPTYKVVNWNITSRCDQNCHFCPNDLQSPSWQACRSCVRRSNDVEAPSLFGDIGLLVKQMVGLGISGIHIRGGNPLLEWDRLISILNSMENYPQVRVGITTPGTGKALDDILSLYRWRNVQLNVVLQGFEDKSNGPVSGGSDVRHLQFRLLDALRQSNRLFSIVVVVSDMILADRDSASRWIFKRWGVMPVFSEFYPSQCEKRESFHFTHVQSKIKSLSPWRDPEEFLQRFHKNTCVSGVMEIALSGNIKPCAGCDDDCGKIVNNDLIRALRGERLYSVWGMAKEQIDQCRDCPLRLACSDCLAAEKLGIKDKRLAAAYCPVMEKDDLFANAGHFEHQGFLYLLSVEKGLERCPK